MLPRPPHAWLTLADTVLALRPLQQHTSASANQDIQARGKILFLCHFTYEPAVSNLTHGFSLSFPKVRVSYHRAAGWHQALHPAGPPLHHRTSQPDDGDQDQGELRGAALLRRLRSSGRRALPWESAGV